MEPNVQATKATQTRYNRLAPVYDALEWFVERRFRWWRKRLWSLIPPGRVLEVGVGTGKNIPYYPAEARVTAVDLSERMLLRALRRAMQEGKNVPLCQLDAQALAFPDHCFDAAVATFVFCSVPDPVQGLRELRRVVRPQGRILLLEHVRVNRPGVGRLMDLLNPLVVRVMGANINRNTVANVSRAGLVLERVDDLGPLGVVKLIIARPD
ncbi:MAG: methyltransferase domain-containing protein [Nitrospinota bacterium]|nr:MAG: methyltransferase domain-containing protein [Nitrospinota bacterium]